MMSLEQAARIRKKEKARERLKGGILAVLFGCAVVAALGLTTSGPNYFRETPITTNGAQDPHYMYGPVSHCTLYGTWDTASVTVETEIEDGGGWVEVGWADFLGATMDVAFTKVELGPGRYRAVVSTAGPSTSLMFYCRWS